MEMVRLDFDIHRSSILLQWYYNIIVTVRLSQTSYHYMSELRKQVASFFGLLELLDNRHYSQDRVMGQLVVTHGSRDVLLQDFQNKDSGAERTQAKTIPPTDLSAFHCAA